MSPVWEELRLRVKLLVIIVHCTPADDDVAARGGVRDITNAQV